MNERVRWVQDEHGDWLVFYRGQKVGELWIDFAEEGGYTAENYAAGTTEWDTNKRRLRRWLSRSLRDTDLHTWWALHVGAREA